MAYDEYLIGTFSPTLDAQTTSPTVGYTTQVGGYVKIGKLVVATLHIVISSISGGSGNARVGGLPFTSQSTTSQTWMAPVLLDGVDTATGVLYYVAQLGANATNAVLIGIRDNTTTLTLDISAFAAGDTIKYTVQYLAAT
jgi:hypothetical protein